MKLQNLSLSLLSLALVGGLSTSAQAVTLPEPTTHTVTKSYYTDYNLSGDRQNPVYPLVTVTATFDGYYGEFEFDHSEFKSYYVKERVQDENGMYTDEILETSNVYVIAEGSTVKYTLSCPEAPEITVHPYLDGIADYHYQTEYLPMGWTSACAAVDRQSDDSKTLAVSNQERTVYSYYKTDDGQYGYAPTLGLARFMFPTGEACELYTNENGEVMWWSGHAVILDKILTVNQEKLDTLVEEGEVCFENFGTYSGDLERSFTVAHTLKYNGLLELFGGTSFEPEVEEEEEVQRGPNYDMSPGELLSSSAESGFVIRFEELEVLEDLMYTVNGVHYVTTSGKQSVSVTNITDQPISGYYNLYVNNCIHTFDLDLAVGETVEMSLKFEYYDVTKCNILLTRFDTQEERTTFMLESNWFNPSSSIEKATTSTEYYGRLWAAYYETFFEHYFGLTA